MTIDYFTSIYRFQFIQANVFLVLLFLAYPLLKFAFSRNDRQLCWHNFKELFYTISNLYDQTATFHSDPRDTNCYYFFK